MSGGMDPVSLHHCVLPTLPKPLLSDSETLDKVTLVMEREGELEGEGVARGAQIQHQERRTVSNAIH